jgi:N-acetylglucosamine repressor
MPEHRKNKTDIKNSNIISVLDSLRQQGPLSRRDLQNMTHLSWGAISSIATKLIDMRLIAEIGPQETPLGRKPAEIDINTQNNYIIGVDLNILGLTVVIADIKGTIVSKKTKLLLYNDRNYILGELTAMLDQAFQSLKAKKVIVIGIAAQGVVDPEAGVSVFAPHFTGWENVDICGMLNKRYRIATYIFHDPDCVLFTERYFSRNKNRNSVLIRLDKGIGMSMYLHDELYSGSSGKAAELGHMTMNIDGPRCSCGKNGCLETYASGKGIVQRFLERVNDDCRTKVDLSDPTSISPQTLYEALKQKDELCIELFDKAGLYIGLAIAHIINLLNPGEIILYGSMADLHDAYEERMLAVVRKNVFFDNHQTSIRFSGLDKDAAALGGALAAFDKHIRQNTDFFSSRQARSHAE